MPNRKLAPEDLYHRCDMSFLDFETTTDITPVRGTIGQERALRALDFGLGMQSKGFNIYILGESGTGKLTSIKERVRKLAADEPVPTDWCYVYNFKEPDVPQAISLVPGKAMEFQRDMQEMVVALRDEIPKIFESKEYERSRSEIVTEFQNRQKEMFGSLDNEAKSDHFSIRKSVSGLMVVPLSDAGEPLTENEFEALDDSVKENIESRGKAYQERLDDIVRTVRTEEKKIKSRMQNLERDAALGSVGHLIDDLRVKYSANAKILTYLDAVRSDILDNLGDFKSADEESASPLPFMKPPRTEPTFTRYKVNVLVNNASVKGEPCIFESTPTYHNLFGRVEYSVQYGMAMTDFTMIKAGSIHRANGGYIVIDALDLLRSMFSYEALKRSIRNREIKIEDEWEQYRPVSTSTLRPEPIPLDIKVVLTGNAYIYYTLLGLDEEFGELFKVKADFESRMQRNEESVRKYAEFISAKCQEEGLLHFNRTGVAKVVEFGSRLAEHSGKLSSKFSTIADIIRESHHWAASEKAPSVGVEHVEKAIKEKVFRNSRIEDRMREMMQEDTIIVRTSGSAVGQVNGLAVLSLGDYSFGKPSRISAVTYAGKGGLMNIERETKMSGKIHEKAILIITNYLGSRFARRRPISLSASITFEQLYDMVEGDSATCAELYALLSSLSDVPLSQSIAITGSMDQNGEVQPIGGVNEKIEGFFDLCRMRGLDGSHGVIIPSRNLRHLMLKSDVVDAVKAGTFTIYTIDNMIEGLEILTGMPAGEPDADGNYPKGTVNHLVAKRLEDISKAIKSEGKPATKKKTARKVAQRGK